MELSELRTLAAVIEAGGFNRAAKRLALTQSAVSQTVARLEEKVGTALIVRSTPPAATEAGQRVLSFARKLGRDLSSLERDLADITRPEGGRARVGASQMVTNLHMADLLTSFAQSAPQAMVDVANFPGRQLLLKARKGAIDLGFGAFQRNMDDFVTHAYLKQTMKLYASPQHPEYKALRRGDERALKRSLLLTAYLDPVEDRPGPGRLRYRFAAISEIESLHLRIDLTARGMALAYLPEEILASHPRRARLKHLHNMEHSTFERQLGIYHLRRRPLSEVAQAFVAHCDEHFGVCGN